MSQETWDSNTVAAVEAALSIYQVSPPVSLTHGNKGFMGNLRKMNDLKLKNKKCLAQDKQNL